MDKEKIKKLAGLLSEQAKNEAVLKAKRDAFNEENKRELELSKGLKVSIAEIKADLGKQAIEFYKKDSSSKTLSGGIKIRVSKSTSVDYDDGKALEFAKSKDMFITLDKKAFEVAAPSLGLDFVTINDVTTYSATFPKVINLED